MPQTQHPKALSYQKLQGSNSKTFDVSNWYPTQLKLCKQWEEEMERLNVFLDSELDSKSDEGEEYKYEHNYETLI